MVYETLRTNEKISLEGEADIYSRQKIILGWEQKRIDNSKVLIVGSNILSEVVLGCLCGIGIGNILMMDKKYINHEPTFLGIGKEGNSKIEKIIRTAEKINDKIHLIGIDSDFSKSMMDYKNFKPNVIIDTTNDLRTKEKTLDYAKIKNINYISSYCNHTRSILSVYNPVRNNIDEILNSEKILNNDNEHGIVTSTINAGIIADEVRKCLFRLKDSIIGDKGETTLKEKEGDNRLYQRLFYNLNSSIRTSLNSDLERRLKSVNGARALMIGAGGIGNYVGLNLALSGFSYVDIMDYDHIEKHNLNRQILFYEKVGQEKATVLAERMKEISKISANPLVEMLSNDRRKSGELWENFFKNKKYDIIFGCLDNQEARYYLSDFAKQFKIPYIDGGTSPDSGDISIFSPGKTMCIKCKRRLRLNPAKAQCVHQVLPSVVSPNAVIGGAMVGEGANILSGEIRDKSLVYSSFRKNRLYQAPEIKPVTNCDCSS